MRQNQGTTILMADDDPAHLLLSEAALAGAGFVVQTAGDGQEAVERFPDVQPDCVILDVMMPRMTGIEACRAIRQLAGGAHVPILMLTGRNDLPAISDAYAAGASDFAQKGLNPRLLVERVRFLLRDVELQAQLQSSRSTLLLAQRIARVGHWELGLDGRTVHLSPMIRELLGPGSRDLAGYEDFVALLDPAERDAARSAFVACATGNGPFGLDHCLHGADGAVICVHQEAELVDAAGAAGSGTVIVTLQDLTRLRRAEDAVRRLSYFDAATGLPNRRYLAERVSEALADPAGATTTAVVAFRVHGFDRICQARGGAFAERLLVQCAAMLESEIARIGEGGTILWHSGVPSVCRSSEGELSVPLRSRVSADHVASVTLAVLEAVSAQALHADAEYVPALSAGIALAHADGAEAEQIISNAHAAAELATEPRGCAFYSPKPQAQLRRRLTVESALRGAVERRELQLVYQPRVDIVSYDVTSVECRVRWERPDFGAVGEEQFLAIAEDSGIVAELGRWTVSEASRQLAAWRERYGRRFFAAVAVTARQLRDPGLAAAVQATIGRHRLAPDALQVEVPESALPDVADAARAALEELRRHGVRTGIDGYGSGRSTLGQIRRVPFHSMKLDRSLVSDLCTDPWAQGVAAAVLAMARAMQMRSVADGIRDGATLEMLRALGCDEAQGPHVARPMAARDFEDWLEDGGAVRLAQQRAVEISDALDGSDSAIDETVRWAGG
jgi:predicted signal transduction protein with EAL and GGDEF domain/DNA-binding response OmpR family regulator